MRQAATTFRDRAEAESELCLNSWVTQKEKALNDAKSFKAAVSTKSRRSDYFASASAAGASTTGASTTGASAVMAGVSAVTVTLESAGAVIASVETLGAASGGWQPTAETASSNAAPLRRVFFIVSGF